MDARRVERGTLLGAVLALGLPLSASGASAARPPRYSAPDECPDEAAWRAALQRRFAQHSHGAAPTDEVAVSIRRTPEPEMSARYVGELEAAGAGSARAVRRVRGASCEEVFEALTLIGALSLRASSARADVTSPGAMGWTTTPDEELALARDPVPIATEAALDPRRLRVGATGLVLWGGAATEGFDLDLGLAVTLRWATDAWQPLVLLGAYTGRERFAVAGTPAQARIERLAAHGVACPLRFPARSPLGVRPCLDLDLGTLAGEGVAVAGSQHDTALWASLGGELRAEWQPWDALELSAMAGAVVALTRPRFYFLPETTAFEADAIAIRAGTSASVSF